MFSEICRSLGGTTKCRLQTLLKVTDNGSFSFVPPPPPTEHVSFHSNSLSKNTASASGGCK